MRPGRSAVTRAGRAFQVAAVATALAVAGLQMRHVHGGVVTDYGADVFGTAWVYATTRMGGTVLQRGRAMGAGRAAAVVFLLCVAWEVGQRAHLVPGRFDPYDLLAYAGTLALCCAIDRRLPFVDTP